MTTDLWGRVRELFGKRGQPETRELEKILTGWRAEARAGNFPVERELFHPLKGWVKESRER